jgi:hypothetical protein
MISLRRSGCYSGDLLEEKWISYLAICLRRRERRVWRFVWEVDVTIGDSIEKRMSRSTISLRGSGFYDWRFCWRLFWGEWTWCSAIFSAISLRRRGHYDWRFYLEANVVFSDSVEEKRTSCSIISLRRSGYYDSRFCWQFLWGEWMSCSGLAWGEMDVTIGDSIDQKRRQRGWRCDRGGRASLWVL